MRKIWQWLCMDVTGNDNMRLIDPLVALLTIAAFTLWPLQWGVWGIPISLGALMLSRTLIPSSNATKPFR